PENRLVKTNAGARIRSRHDEDASAGITRVDCRTDARQRFVTADDRLPFGVTAALWRDLILEHDRGKSRALVSLHRAFDVLRAAEAGVAVSDQRDGNRAADVLSLVSKLTVGDQKI